DTWIASPYAPMGRARPVDDGFEVSGRWQVSSGTDHRDWILAGGFVIDDAGELVKPLDVRHFVLPRADYQILDDTWNVVGLKGTGSKDVLIEKSFVPEYRTIRSTKVVDGSAARESNRGDNPLY